MAMQLRFNRLFLSILWLFLWAFSSSSSAQTVLINEFMASNGNTLADPFGDFDDWVELYNPGQNAVDIGGWYVSDDGANLTSHKIPTTSPAATTIAAGGYLVLWFDGEAAEGVLHCKPKLSAGGEAIFLTAADGTTVVDSRVFGAQSQDISEGRVPNGGPNWDFFATPTPGAANTSTSGSPDVAPVIASQSGGLFTAPLTVSLSCSTPNAQIRYTTDGTEPDASSPLYTQPLLLSATTPLRARAFGSNLNPSPILTQSYLFNISHTFPVVSMVFQPADFFDPTTGIYTNYTLDLDANANIEFFEPGADTAAFNQLVETSIQGTASATAAQKSLNIKPKAALGSAYINYKLFPDLDFDKYKRVVLRNGGQDWNVMMFRDELVSSLADDLSDLNGIVKKPKLYLQASRPSVVYYNGEYWGIHNVKERMNTEYVEQHFDLQPNTYDMIENFSEALSGDTIEWFKFHDYLTNNNFQDDARFQELVEKINYKNYLDYCAFYLYVDNQDWPGNNVRRFRERKPDGKWNWVSYDFDYTFGLYQSTGWNTGDPTPNSLERILNPFSYIWPNPDWATLLFRKCWQNEGFRRDFANRSADFMNTIFDPGRINNRLNDYKNLYEPEIEKHFNRWTGSYYEPYWLENIEKTRYFSNERPQWVRQYMDAALPEVLGNTNVTLTAAPINGGSVHISTITLDQANFPWTGNYFTGIKIPVWAEANPGFKFVKWSDPSYGTADTIAVTLNEALTLIAIFEPIVAPDICEPSTASPWLEYIKKIQVGSYSRESGKEFYTQVPGVSLDMAQDVNYPVVLTSGFSFETFNEYWRVWIDYNQDGKFSDTEIAFQGLAPQPPFADNATSTVNGFIRIPEDAKLGITQMRIGMKRGDYPSPCEIVPFGEFEDYSIQILPPVVLQCQIVATASNPICFNRGTGSNPSDDTFTFTLTVSGTDTGTGWVTSIGGVTFTGNYGEPKRVGPFRIADGDLNFTVVDRTDAFCTAVVFVQKPDACSFDAPLAYCASSSQYPWHEWISKVKIGNYVHYSQKNYYTNVSSPNLVINRGVQVPVELQASFSFFTEEQYWKIWIDWNKDGVFDNHTETVLRAIMPKLPDGTSSALLKDSIFVPMTSALGATGMRVSMKKGGFADPCEVFGFGEVQDYTIVINSDSNNIGNGGPLQGGGTDSTDTSAAADSLLRIYPNPTNDKITLQFNQLSQKSFKVYIYNVLGAEIKSFVSPALDTDYYKVDVGDIESGPYFLFVVPEGMAPIGRSFTVIRTE